MECPHKECVKHADCGILDITKKIPEKASSCSYSVIISKNKKKNKGLENGTR